MTNLGHHPPTGVGPSREMPHPLYFMIKPTPPARTRIDRQRHALGIARDYGRERFHVTLLPLGDGRHVPQSLLASLSRAAASLHAEPFDVAFDRVRRNALVGGRTLHALRRFQQCLAERLAASGLWLPGYEFRPHLSLAYGEAPERNIAIAPIGWTVEELLLVRSIHGEGRHELLGRSPLVRRQGAFDFR